MGRLTTRFTEPAATARFVFEKVVEVLHPERSLSHLPFTSVMFMTQNGLMEKMKWGGIDVEFLESEMDCYLSPRVAKGIPALCRCGSRQELGLQKHQDGVYLTHELGSRWIRLRWLATSESR